MDNLRGAVLMTLAMAGFALEDMLIKLMADAMPTWQIILLLGGGAPLYSLLSPCHGGRPCSAVTF